MLRASIAAGAVLALLASRGQAGYGPGYGNQVAHVLASMQDGRVVIQQFISMYRPETATRTVRVRNKDGQVEEIQQTYTFMVAETKQVTHRLDPAQVQASDAEGNQVGTVALAIRLRTEVPALLAIGKADLEPYRRVLKRGTLILSVAPESVVPKMPSVNGESPKKIDPLPEKEPSEKLQPPAKEGPEKLPLPTKEAPEKPQPLGQPTPIPGGVQPPRGMQPQPASASVDSKGTLHVRDSHGYTETATAEYVLEQGGVKMKEQVPIKTVHFVIRVRALVARAASASLASGKALDRAALPQLLKKERPVVVSADGRPVDPFYLLVIRDEVPVLVLPVPQPQLQGGYGVPLPVPPPEEAPKKLPSKDVPSGA